MEKAQEVLKNSIARQFLLPVRQVQIRRLSSSSEVYCVCRTPDPTGFMIACDHCDQWFHGHCISITPEVAATINKYCCTDCERKNSRLTTIYNNTSSKVKGTQKIKQQLIKEPTDHKDFDLPVSTAVKARPKARGRKRMKQCRKKYPRKKVGLGPQTKRRKRMTSSSSDIPEDNNHSSKPVGRVETQVGPSQPQQQQSDIPVLSDPVRDPLIIRMSDTVPHAHQDHFCSKSSGTIDPRLKLSESFPVRLGLKRNESPFKQLETVDTKAIGIEQKTATTTTTTIKKPRKRREVKKPKEPKVTPRSNLSQLPSFPIHPPSSSSLKESNPTQVPCLSIDPAKESESICVFMVEDEKGSNNSNNVDPTYTMEIDEDDGGGTVFFIRNSNTFDADGNPVYVIGDKAMGDGCEIVISDNSLAFHLDPCHPLNTDHDYCLSYADNRMNGC